MTVTDSPAAAFEAAPNEVRRFIIENQPVRGYWVDLESAWQDLRAHTDYPPAVRDLLGEAVSAAVLLAATLKFEGTLTLQLEGQGLVRLLVAQCSHDFRVRAVARLSEPEAEDEDSARVVDLGARSEGTDPFTDLGRAASADAFRRLVGESGRVLVTIEAAEREMRYQGIVP